MVRLIKPPTWEFPNYFARLPQHYYNHMMDLKKPMTERIHEVHPKGEYLDWKMNEEMSQVEKVRDLPIKIIYPKEADYGIWGGEGIIKGYEKLRKYYLGARPVSRIWFPNLHRAVFYSEILDKYLKIICTKRTLDLVDDAYGFDGYILRTPAKDLKSQLALHLRRFMLIKLAKKDFPTEEKANEMCEKYADCIIPLEEAEWFGLTLTQAINKQKILEAQQNKPIPLKVKFAEELIEELKKMKESGELEMIIREEKKQGFLGKLKSKLPFTRT